MAAGAELLGSDIAVGASHDLVIDDAAGDFALAAGINCVKQDLRSGLSQHPGDDIFAPWEGALIPRQVPTDDIELIEFARRYEDQIASDPRVKPSPIDIYATEVAGVPHFAANFKTIDEQVVENFVL